ncbi:MAG: hypothetical protein WEE64_10370 [Dehalococcoidia bacterium]
MEQLDILGMQQDLGERKSYLMLRSPETGAVFAVTLSPHQVDLIETASCKCARTPSAAESVASALGLSLQSIVLELHGQKPQAKLNLSPEEGEALAVDLHVIEAFAVALRHGLPLLLKNPDGAKEDGRHSLSSPVRSFIETLDLSGL